jgi:hypothetical protein
MPGVRATLANMEAFPGIDPEEESARHHGALRPVRHVVREVVDFSLPDETVERFVGIRDQIISKPPMVARLTHDGESRRNWYLRFGNMVSWDIPEGLGAAHYHAGRAEAFESELLQRCTDALEELAPQAPDWPSVTRLYTRKLNYEYQAFQFALRRTLDYVSVAGAAFFKRECARITDLPRVLSREGEPEETEMRERLVACVENGRESLADVIEKGNVRDQIAHYEAVEAGTLNIHWGKNFTIVSLAEGGEKLDPWTFSSEPPPRRYGSSIGFIRLTPRLCDRLERVERFVFSALEELGFPS